MLSPPCTPEMIGYVYMYMYMYMCMCVCVHA